MEPGIQYAQTKDGGVSITCWMLLEGFEDSDRVF